MTVRSVLAPGGWARACVLAVLGLLLAGASARGALVQALARARPDLVLGLAPQTPAAIDAEFKRALDSGEVSEDKLRDWSARARAALAVHPLEPGLLRIASGEPGRATPEALLQAAERLSRRDSLVELALIEVAVNAGRTDQALVHYDRALSVFPDMRDVLFPILVGAISEPNIRAALTRVAAQRRPWIDPFLSVAVRQTEQPRQVAALLDDMARLAPPPPGLREHQAALAGRFIAAGDYAGARGLARRAVQGDPDAVDRIAIAPATWETAARPLTWTRAETDGVDAELFDDASVQVSVRPGGAGLALFRMLVREPGRYRFSVRTSPAEDADPATGRWDLLCLRQDGSQTLATVGVDPRQGAVAERSFDLPPACKALRLDFHIDNASGGTEAGLTIRDVRLARAGSAS